MAFLLINNYSVPIAHEQASEDNERLGSQERAFGGELIDIERADPKKIWSMETIPLNGALGHSLEMLLLGRGEVWSFDEGGVSPNFFWGSKGTGTFSITGTITTSIGLYPAVFDRSVAFNPTAKVIFDLTLPNDWTVIIRQGASQHFVKRSDGAQWIDGIRDDITPIPDIGVTAGDRPFIENTTGAIKNYDDFVVLPFLLAEEIVLEVAPLVTPWADLPWLRTSGNVALSAVYFTEGTNVKTSLSQFHDSSSTWVPAGRVVSFTLREA